ncbi:MAG: amidohydrolase [Thermodesulfobacterium sp.]|nr:amidohydrolase [Thermodesulfobacterium sp.]
MVKIFSAKWILVSPEKAPLKNGCIVIENDKIIDSGLKEEIIPKYQNAKLIDLGNKLIFPGLINAHTHVPMSIFRGIAEDLPLMVWLKEYIFPIEAKLKKDWVYWGTKLSLVEMIKSGITTFCDMYLFEKEVIKAVEESGLKALVGEGLFDFPSPSYGPLEKGFELTEELLKNFEKHPRIKIAVSPHTLYTCSPETVKKCIELSEKFNAKLHIHLCETKEEIKEVKNKYGKRSVEILKELGGINENLIAAHCVKLNLEEIELMAKHSAGIIHCPESNLKLGSGIAPLTEMLNAGVKLGLGTDGPASNNDFDMFSEMRTACLIQKGLKEDPTVIKANDVLNMSTCWGAGILGFSDTGKLLPNYKADLAVLDLSHYSMQPDYNPIALLVYSAKSGFVSDLMVDGQWIMRNYKIISIKEEEVIEKIKNIKEEILSLLSKK